jgi:hypothetical protein
MMHEREKSSLAIVAMKPANKAGDSAAEPGERRAGAEENAAAVTRARLRTGKRV